MLHDYAQQRNDRSHSSWLKVLFLLAAVPVFYYYPGSLLDIQHKLADYAQWHTPHHNQVMLYLAPPSSPPKTHIIRSATDKAGDYLHSGYSLESDCLSQQRATTVQKTFKQQGYSLDIRSDGRSKEICHRLIYSSANDAAILSRMRSLLAKKSITSTTYIAR